jgi:hypothetical protein
MSNEHDPRLQALFAQAAESLDEEDIASHVVAAARRRRCLTWVAGFAALLLALLATRLLLAIPLLEFAVLISTLLTTSLVDLGEGWLALALLPVNSFAGLFALLLRAALLIRRRMVSGFA